MPGWLGCCPNPPKPALLDPKAGALDPNAGVLAAPNKLPPELFEPNRLLLELAAKKPGLLLAPKPPGVAPNAGAAAELAEPPKPKLGPEDVLAPKLNPVLCAEEDGAPKLKAIRRDEYAAL